MLPSARLTACFLLAATLTAALPSFAGAGSGDSKPAAAVYTRGEFRAASSDAGGHYAHIKIAPGRKIPFSTITYRVNDVQMLAQFTPGMQVEFRAQRIDGENVLTAIRPLQR